MKNSRYHRLLFRIYVLLLTLYLHYVMSLKASVALNKFEFNSSTFIDCLISIHDDLREVEESVSTIISGDKAESLKSVESLNFS